MNHQTYLRNASLAFFFGVLTYHHGSAQDAAGYFHQGASLYIGGKDAEARQQLQSGLARYPNDPKLNALLKEIKENDQKNQQDKQDQEKQKQEQQKQQKQNQQSPQEQQSQQKQQQAQNKPQPSQAQPKEEKSKEGKDAQEREVRAQRLKQMNLTEDKARMILDAMKNSEIQYLQQRRREKTQKTDKNKPDW